MDEPTVLLTITEVVARLREAGIGATDVSRRSYTQQLMKVGMLEDRLVLKPGRKRAGKNDARVSAGSVDRFLARRAAPAGTARTDPKVAADGRTAVAELTARIDMLMLERQNARIMLTRQLQDHENESYELKREVLDLQHQARLNDIDATTIRDELRDEASTRQTYESVIMQLVGPEDLRDLLGPR